MRILRLIKKNLLFILLIALVAYIIFNNMNMEGFETTNMCTNPTLVRFARNPTMATAPAANAICGNNYEAVISGGKAYCVKKCSVISAGFQPANNETWQPMCKPYSVSAVGNPFNRMTNVANRKAC